jgi:hypothetical protein
MHELIDKCLAQIFVVIDKQEAALIHRYSLALTQVYAL